jgi:hypothetical protein
MDLGTHMVCARFYPLEPGVTAAGPHDGVARGARRGYRGARMEEERGGVERERGEGELTLGSKSGDHRLQNLGHHGGEREVATREKSNERKGPGGQWGAGAPGARGPSWAGLGWAAPRAKTPWHAQP